MVVLLVVSNSIWFNSNAVGQLSSDSIWCPSQSSKLSRTSLELRLFYLQIHSISTPSLKIKFLFPSLFCSSIFISFTRDFWLKRNLLCVILCCFRKWNKELNLFLYLCIILHYAIFVKPLRFWNFFFSCKYDNWTAKEITDIDWGIQNFTTQKEPTCQTTISQLNLWTWIWCKKAPTH